MMFNEPRSVRSYSVYLSDTELPTFTVWGSFGSSKQGLGMPVDNMVYNSSDFSVLYPQVCGQFVETAENRNQIAGMICGFSFPQLWTYRSLMCNLKL